MLFRVPELVHTLRKNCYKQVFEDIAHFFQDNDNETMRVHVETFKIASLEPLYPGILGP
jgi:hypothetical protein